MKTMKNAQPNASMYKHLHEDMHVSWRRLAVKTPCITIMITNRRQFDSRPVKSKGAAAQSISVSSPQKACAAVTKKQRGW